MSQAQGKPPRVIATVRAADGYVGILQAFRARQAELGLSVEKIEAIAQGKDCENRYATKWLSGAKGLGPKSWGDALGSMGMKLIFVEDDDQMRKLQKHLQSRNNSQVRTNVPLRIAKWLFTSRSGRKIAKAREARKTQEQRSAGAAHASNTRWKRERARRRAARCAPLEAHSDR